MTDQGDRTRGRILYTVHALFQEKGWPVTVREIMAETGYSSGCVSHHLQVLVKRGLLSKQGYYRRGVLPANVEWIHWRSIEDHKPNAGDLILAHNQHGWVEIVEYPASWPTHWAPVPKGPSGE